MMYLHEERALFKDVIAAASADQRRPVSIIEKDYYVTMILNLLSRAEPDCVFKGGTSLSKCFHVIDRFSEDIDIAFSIHLAQSHKRNLKNAVIAGISESLHLPISNWKDTHSRRDYNCYIFDYEPVGGETDQKLSSGIKMEIALGSQAFPTVKLPVDSFVYQFLKKEDLEIAKDYELEPFEMTVQSIERTFTDKVFAICDYYLEGDFKRHSRHIYDLYKLLPEVCLNNEFKILVSEIRKHRSKMRICPSAQPEIIVTDLLREIIEKSVYESDYKEITAYFLNESIEYNEVVKVLEEIIDSGVF